MARGINTKCLHLEEEEGCCNNYGSISFPIYQTATYEHPAVGQTAEPDQRASGKNCSNFGKRNRCTGFFHWNGSNHSGNGAV